MHLNLIDTNQEVTDAWAKVLLAYPADSGAPEGQLPDHELKAAIAAQLACADMYGEAVGTPRPLKSVTGLRCDS